MKVKTRFAPSPSGDLHIGGARTALFNFLFAKSQKGNFLVRIENTDDNRNSKESIKSIVDGLDWLKIKFDGEIIYQKDNINKHLEYAKKLISKGCAYKCYHSSLEISNLKEKKKFISKWRDVKDNNNIKKPYTIRLKIPRDEIIVIKDLVQGKVKVNSNELDDCILVRSDGKPTFMLASVVDDILMGITHVIRGDDHLTNTFRQYYLYKFSERKLPNFAHLPLILNERGEKLSKRDNVPSILDFRSDGFLNEAICNYILRLGWSFKNYEIFNLKDSINIFDLRNVGKSPAKIDRAKIKFLNEHYLKNLPKKRIFNLYKSLLKEKKKIMPIEIERNLFKFFDIFLERVCTLNEIVSKTNYFLDFKGISKKYWQLIEKKLPTLNELTIELKSLESWTIQSIEKTIKMFVKKKNIKFFDIGMPIRLLLTNNESSPSIVIIMLILGKKEVIRRLENVMIC